MAKKKKKAPVEETILELTPRQIEDAKAAILEVGADVSYAKAKSLLIKKLGVARSVANAIIVALHQSGFGGESKNWFEHPDAQCVNGVVRGARQLERMSVMSQDDPSVELELNGEASYLPGDVVELRRAEHGWRIGRFISRGQKRWVCRITYSGSRSISVTPVSAFAPFELSVPREEIPAEVDLKRDAIEVELDETELSPRKMPFNWEGPDWNALEAHFVRRVGRTDDPLGEMAIASAEHGVPIEFSAEALDEALALPDKVDRRSLAHRVNLTDLPFVTIDGEDARDFDDAVYCEKTDSGWRLLVAIADVSHYVRPGSALDRDAQMRGTSVYFPASVVPMLPEKLSNGLCSLNPHVDRLVMVCDALVSSEGETTAYQFYPAVIHSHARLTYTQVWSALSGEAAGLEAVGERIEEVRRLHALYGALRRARKARSALDFETQESQVIFDEKGGIAGFRVREHNDAHRLIEECMLVANVCAAEFVLANKQLTLFRVHEKPSADRLATLKSVLAPFKLSAGDGSAKSLQALIEATKAMPFLQTAILRTMSKACYQPENVGHFGLQYQAYAHFTSPIRRYPDLLLHRTIRGILTKRRYVPSVVFDDAAVMSGYHARSLGAKPEREEKPASNRTAAGRAQAWARLGILTSAAERRADDASRDVMQFLKCDYLRSRVGRKFKGTVTGMCAAGVFVSLDEMPIEGFVHISNLGWGYYDYDESQMTMTSYDEMTQVRIGDRVVVRLDAVELETRRINFQLVTNSSRHVVKGGRAKRQRYRDDWF
ncbi:VacB/RNase II family 3'-5' exoribonuclease [Sutterella massiliensis]|uniref:Ribonuclease R n=1 Tax=Sutterella massiliensis TaxID=1816689 RepID=A0ABS2DRW9_9BURK|nr:VacB/RNase II family 3'-5' exoribonuclease [Sutterella massiliensis]MBM6703480.1 VacB/RNase II family 3'-5' exoribonuclease [Sutterella massiliensis]